MKRHSLTIHAPLLLALAGAPALADPVGEGPPGTRIVGPWRVTITPVDCTTGEAFTAFAFKSQLTFGAGGTLAETNASRGFQPDQRSPGHGYWEYTGRETYRAYFEAFIRFDSVDPLPPARPYQRGVQSVDQSIEMRGSNGWVSDALVIFRDAAGEIVPPSGCATAAAERMR